MKIFSTSLIAACLLSAVSVSHASEGIYLGFNLGQASYDVSQSDAAAALDDGSLTSLSIDDTDSSYRWAIGYQLLRYFSLEGGYLDLGDITVNATSNGSGSLYVAGPVNSRMGVDGLFFDVKGLLPLNEQVSLYGKFGLLKWDGEVTLSNVDGSVNEDGDDTFFGIGGSYNIYDTLALNVDYTFYKLDDLDVDVFSVGIQFGY
jgi:OOP family OmpA-OmpF porin